MEYKNLGTTGITVSRLCVGSLTVGPLQAALPVGKGAGVIAHAFLRGVNFVDTAQYYRNYDYIREAMRLSGRYDAVISTKTYSYSRAAAAEAVEEARRGLDRDVIDIFMLHEQESLDTLRGHTEALEYLFEQKARGVLRAVGVSTHHIAGVEGVCELRRRGLYPIDVVHPIFNKRGIGIADGGIAGMTDAMRRAKAMGIGIFAMKSLGGGHLYASAEEAFDFALDTDDGNGSPLADAVAVGMQSIAEADADIDYFERRGFSADAKKALAGKKRRLFIEEDCEGCGKCVERCGQGALRITGGRSVCDAGKCVMCGYCSAVCPVFAIKVL